MLSVSLNPLCQLLKPGMYIMATEHILMAYFINPTRSQSYFMTVGLPPIRSSWRQAPWDSRPVILFAVVVLNVISSLTRGWGCRLHLLPGLASAFILRSSLARLMTILYCLRVEIPQPVGPSLLYLPGTGWSSYNPKALGSFFVASYDSQSYGGGIRTASTRGWIPPISLCFYNNSRLGKNVTAPTNKHATIDGLLDSSFSMWSAWYQRKVGD
jgi:hypothetical protein